jgi:hypothetical protein
MTAAVSRDLQIVYGSRTVGGTTDYLIDGPVVFSKSYREISVDFDVVISEASEANYGTAYRAVRDDFALIDKALTVTMGGETLLSLDPASGTNTALLTRASVSKFGSRFDTNRSAGFHATITATLPSSGTGAGGARNGRDQAQEDLVVDAAGKKLLTLSGVWTAVGANDARAQFAAQFDTYAAAVQSAVGGGTWEEINRSTRVDDDDKEVTYTVVYKDLLANQSDGTLNDTDLKNTQMTIARGRTAPGSADGSAEPLYEVFVSYSTAVDRTQRTDLSAVWTSKALPHIVARAKALSGASLASVTRATPVYDEDANTITATVQILLKGGGNLLALSENMTETTEGGGVFVPVWSGVKYDRDVYQGPASKRRLRVIEKLEVSSVIARTNILGQTGGFELAGEVDRRLLSFDGTEIVNGYALTSTTVETAPLVTGVRGYQISLVRSRTVEEWERVAGGGGGFRLGIQ